MCNFSVNIEFLDFTLSVSEIEEAVSFPLAFSGFETAS